MLFYYDRRNVYKYLFIDAFTIHVALCLCKDDIKFDVEIRKPRKLESSRVLHHYPEFIVE